MADYILLEDGVSKILLEDASGSLLLEVQTTNDRRAVVTWAELETPDAPRRAVVTWAEFEVPNEPRRAVVTWGEFEVPNAPRRGIVTWAEFETPDAPRRGVVTWAEFEVPDAVVTDRRGIVTWAEFEVPDAAAEGQVSGGGGPPPRKRWRLREGRRALVAAAVFEVPDAPKKSRRKRPVKAATPAPPVPLPARPGLEFVEPPTPPRRAVITWAVLEVPDNVHQARGDDLEVLVVALTYLRKGR